VKELLVVLSARASYSRVRSVLLALKKYNASINTHVVLVASAASNKYGKLEHFLIEDNIKVNWKIESQADAALQSAMVRTTSSTMLGIADYILNFNIDGTLIIADRHETIAGAIASSYLNRKTFHLLGGEVSGNIDNKVRYANTFLSDFHFVATQESKVRLEKSGIADNSIFITGCPSLDFVPSESEWDKSEVQKYFGGIGLSADEVLNNNYIVVLQHAETTSLLNPRDQISHTIEAVDKIGMPALWIWPNSDSGSDEFIREITKAREAGKLSLVHFERSVEPESFLKVLRNSKCIVGNSSVAIRECSLMGTPAVNIGSRQKNRERAQNVVDAEFASENVSEAIVKQLQHGPYKPSQIYGDGKSGERIAVLISDLLT
jgi:UDP-hydrolysing UDP-N-acetyl-D-glucosamine 2-epimerase